MRLRFGVPMLVAVAFASCARPRAVETPTSSVAVPGPKRALAPPNVIMIRTTDELVAVLAKGESEAWLAPGTYRGNFVARRPITLHGTEGVILDGAHAGTVFAIEASDVSIDNVIVRASGRRHTAEDSGIKAKGERAHIKDVRVEDVLFGIVFEECKFCSIDGAHVVGPGDLEELRGDGIKLWESHDSSVRNSLVEDARDVVVWYTKRATLENDVVRRGRYGTHFMYAHDCTLTRSRFEHDVVGLFVMYSNRIKIEDSLFAGAHGAAGVGIGFKDSDSIDLRRNTIVGNTTGTYIDNTPRVPETPLVLEDNLFALNQVALDLHTNGAGLQARRSDFRDNAELVTLDGGGDALAASFEGNYFSEYQGYDLDEDGVGDVPYELKLLSHELTNSKPQIRLFQGTLALGTIDVVARAVPVLAAKRVLVDLHPRMEARR